MDFYCPAWLCLNRSSKFARILHGKATHLNRQTDNHLNPVSGLKTVCCLSKIRGFPLQNSYASACTCRTTQLKRWHHLLLQSWRSTMPLPKLLDRISKLWFDVVNARKFRREPVLHLQQCKGFLMLVSKLLGDIDVIALFLSQHTKLLQNIDFAVRLT